MFRCARFRFQESDITTILLINRPFWMCRFENKVMFSECFYTFK